MEESERVRRVEVVVEHRREPSPGDTELLEARQAARASKDFAEADRLRDEIAKLGWEVRDVPGGYELLRAA